MRLLPSGSRFNVEMARTETLPFEVLQISETRVDLMDLWVAGFCTENVLGRFRERIGELPASNWDASRRKQRARGGDLVLLYLTKLLDLSLTSAIQVPLAIVHSLWMRASSSSRSANASRRLTHDTKVEAKSSEEKNLAFEGLSSRGYHKTN